MNHKNVPKKSHPINWPMWMLNFPQVRAAVRISNFNLPFLTLGRCRRERLLLPTRVAGYWRQPRKNNVNPSEKLS
jgi:hypothetical protein